MPKEEEQSAQPLDRLRREIGTGEAREDGVILRHHLGRAFARDRAKALEFSHFLAVEVENRDPPAIAQQGHGQLAADLDQADKADIHATLLRLPHCVEDRPWRHVQNRHLARHGSAI